MARKMTLDEFKRASDEFIETLKRKNLYRKEVLLFCEEHLVDFTDDAQFSICDNPRGFSVKISFRGFKLWEDIKDTMLTFLSFNEYNIFDIHFQTLAWIYVEKQHVFDNKNSLKVNFLDEIISDDFFINEEILEIKLNFTDVHK